MQSLHGNFWVPIQRVEKILHDLGSPESDGPEEVLSVMYEQNTLGLMFVRKGFLSDAELLKEVKAVEVWYDTFRIRRSVGKW